MPLLRKKGLGEYTYNDYLNWPEDERWELIEGEAYAMSAAPSRIHQEIIGELFLQIGSYLRGKNCRVYVAPFDVVLIDQNQNEQDSKNVVQPDITIVCNRGKLDEKGCKGSPDMVIEVVSPSTVSQDYVKKLNLYEKYGIREYWIVNPKNNNIFVYKLDENNQYTEVKVYYIKDKIQVGIFDNLVIDLSQLFD